MTSSTETLLKDDFADAVIEGLSQRRKVIPARYFYDRKGSELFEAITALPEYYPTRTETALLDAHAPEIGRIAGPGKVVVEFGSGSSMKTPVFVEAVRAAAYVPIDISADFLRDAAAGLSRALPDLDILPVAADFTKPIALPRSVEGRSMIGFFPGSTIGNLSHAAAVDLLRAFRITLGADPWLAIGIDLRKNPRLIEAAYDDAAGVTAAFNLNLLARVNRELGGDIPLDAFEHHAVWNDDLGRIEMHLAATRDVRFHAAGETFFLRDGETIHTENSHKYMIEETRLLARAAGWQPIRYWTDARDLFSLHLWRGGGGAMEP
ncbi:L-histidine N(alpha)-methyltransferase [Sphingosinicella soli]|uniref:Dimethylhistidine N-methyltransferase n=1 Tax=Sphingosinicella soli TaxID=333708 RepID=A0A7W7B1X1_9SPHN|nr:L-histidine N(alpha)-methyltransferase [Sphingosinicella soli]MBB4632369.1 dimethylhistidine N-methyltransferase [Sphingosinicella soli]